MITLTKILAYDYDRQEWATGVPAAFLLLAQAEDTRRALGGDPEFLHLAAPAQVELGDLLRSIEEDQRLALAVLDLPARPPVYEEEENW